MADDSSPPQSTLFYTFIAEPEVSEKVRYAPVTASLEVTIWLTDAGHGVAPGTKMAFDQY